MGMNKNVTLEDIIVRKGELDSVDMDGEVVMMNIEKGKYYGFNSVGSRIWQLIEKPTTAKTVTYNLLQEFNVEASTCENTVLQFINDLYKEELISIV